MKRTTQFLLVIILVAVFLRFYQINSNPRGMYGDGLTAVYDAYSILKTGHDQKGEFMPLVFSLGGGRPAGYVYATVPFVALFGLTPLAANMVSILSGLGIILLLYLLGKHFFSENVGFAISVVAALSPWELSLSRGPFETHFALFLTLLGFFAYLKGFKNIRWFIVFGLSFGLALQTYSTYKLTIPFFTVFLLIWIKKDLLLSNLRKPLFLISLAVIFASAILSVYLTVSRGSQDRFDIINIFRNPALKSSISQKVRADRKVDSLPYPISYVMHTPQMELAGTWAENYFSNFLPDFLFIHGDGQVRHNPAEIGELYWVDLLFILLGIGYLYKTKKQLLVLLVGWILIAPLSTSLVGGVHALRSSFLLPPLLILSGIGLWNVLNIRNRLAKKMVLVFLGFVFVFQFIFFIDRFYFVAPQKNGGFWSYPAMRAVEIALKNQKNFDYIILSNDIDNMEFAYPVYAKLDPILVIKQNESRAKIDEFQFFKYGNVYIGSLPNTRVMQFIKNLPGQAMYIGAAKEQPFLQNYRIINGPDEQPDLIITSTGKSELITN